MVNNTLGFFKDERGLKLAEVFSNGMKIKEIYIDIYPNNPFDNAVSLMLRCSESNVSVDNDGRSIVIKKNDKYNTYIAELSLATIEDCYFKMHTENSFDFVFNCQNIFYKITIFK